MKQYLKFVRQERRLLSFGLTFTFFSSFGQTFLISLFVPFFLSNFNLSNTTFGLLFSAATLLCAFSLPFLGKWVDRLPLKHFSLMVATALMLAAVTVSVAWHIAIFFIGLFMLRLTGQGLSKHTAQTAMAKFYHYERGKALSIASLGFPMAEAVLPLAMAGLIPLLGWRGTWGGIAIAIGLVLIPYLLLTFTGEMNTNTIPKPQTQTAPQDAVVYRQVLTDRRFYFLLPAALLPAFWITGLFLYQVNIAHQLGWSATLIASAFIAHAASRIISALLGGEMMDRISAQKMFPYHLIPLGLGLLFGYFHPGSWSAFAYMSLMGITLGISANLKTALWTELYGSDALGAVRSMFTSIKLVATALSPFIMGWMIDTGITMSAILLTAIITVIAATGFAGLAFAKK